MTKTTAEHKRDGTYRPDRHGTRVDASINTGEPVRVLKLDRIGKKVRKIVIDNAPEGVLAPQDGVMLDTMSSLFSTWVQAHQKAEGYAAMCNALGLFKAFAGIAAKYGMTPMDRTKLRTEGEKAPADNSFLALLRQKKN
jgi:hypothetical protein